MKAKFLIVVLAALVLATGTVWAQKGHHNRRAEHKELTTEQVAKKMTDRMKENLSLSDEQVKQVYPICLEQAQAMREHRAERREMAEKSRDCAGPACRKGDANPGHHRRPCNGAPCVDKK